MASPNKLFEELQAGSRVALAQAITLTESRRPQDRTDKNELLRLCFSANSTAVRVAVSGLPGAGKSTFIEQLGLYLTELGLNVAVLAIDPSSDTSGGSILGDKTRMEKLSTQENAFIRPSPSSGNLGGVAEMTRESISICEAAGYDVTIIETIGVGQAEYTVHTMTDIFILLTIPGAGDVLQGIKRGIMEKADLVVVNKSDGTQVDAAKQTAIDIRSALRLSKGQDADHIPVLQISSLTGADFENAWSTISEKIESARADGSFGDRRSVQKQTWFDEAVQNMLRNALRNDVRLTELRSRLLQNVRDGSTHPIDGAEELVNAIVGNSIV